MDNTKYGSNECTEWCPFENDVTLFAQKIAHENNFRCKVIYPSDNITEKIEEAKNRNEIVILIVDNWSLKIPKYRNKMEKYDEGKYYNCAVLIPRNDDRYNTKDFISESDQTVCTVFKDTHTMVNDIYFDYPITTEKQLKER